MPTNYECYCQGWQDCMTGADGRYPAVYHPEYSNQQQNHFGWREAFNAEDTDRPLPADFLGYE